jgi:DNA-binding transcriptional regulator YdaS (Cro superfamily)
MNLRTYFLNTKPAQRKEFADALGVNVDYLYMCSRGQRKLGADLCKRIVALDSRFTLAELRPDIWGNGIDGIAASDDTQPPVGGTTGKRKEAKRKL